MDGASVKDRFRVNEDRVNAFVSGQYTSDQIVNELRAKGTDEAIVKDTEFIATGVQKSFREKKLDPILRVFYNRTAFQLPDSQMLRISLDTDLTFIREDHFDGRMRRQNPPNNWRRTDVGIDSPFHYLPDSEILRFPYAVLETKLQTHLGQQPPSWLTSLIEGHLVHEVPRFSKYLHGACYFYKNKLALLPWWLSEMNVDIRKPRAENIGLTRSKSFKPLIDGRYRRAMIEEKERANKAAVVGPTPASTTNKNLAENVKELNRRRSTSIDEKTAAAWRPTANRSNKNEEYTLIDLNSSSNQNLDNPHAVSEPLLGQDNYSHNHNSGFTMKNNDSFDRYPPPTLPPPVSKFYQAAGNNSSGRLVPNKDIAYKKNLGQPVDVDLEGGKGGKGINKKVKVEPKTFFANERTFIAWLQFCALLLTVALNLLNFGDNTSRIVGGVFIGLSAGIAIYALYRFEKRAWYDTPIISSLKSIEVSLLTHCYHFFE